VHNPIKPAQPEFGANLATSGPPAISVSKILGWTGATALALAYLIRLAVDSICTTPANASGIG